MSVVEATQLCPAGFIPGIDDTSLGRLVSQGQLLEGDRRAEAMGSGPPLILSGGQGDRGLCGCCPWKLGVP